MLIYLGVLDDEKTAVFLVDSGVVAQGDGTCRPSRTTCETIRIREGETEFFDVPDDSGEVATDGSGQQYELDVVKIHKTTTTDAKKAKKARASVSPKGRMILRARVAGDGPLRYRYDTKTGRLREAVQEGLQGRRRQGRARRASPLLVSGHRGRRVSPGARLSFQACRCA